MKKLITLLLLFTGFAALSQTNATFNTIDVRTRETFRGPFYIYDSVFFKPSSVNIPLLNPGDPLGWFLTTSKGPEAQLVRATINSIADSLTIYDVGYFRRDSVTKLLTTKFANDMLQIDSTTTVNGLFTSTTRLSGRDAYVGFDPLSYGFDNMMFGFGDEAEGDTMVRINMYSLQSPVDSYTVSMFAGPAGNAIGFTSYFSSPYKYFELRKDIGAGTNDQKEITITGGYPGDQITLKVDHTIDPGADTTATIKLNLRYAEIEVDSINFNAKSIIYEDTFWDDASVSGTSLAPGANAPSLRTFKGGIKQLGYAPSVQNDISYGQCQFSHRMKLGTDIEAHIHYAIEETAEAGDTVVLAFEYSWADMSELFPVSDTITLKIPVAAKTALTHYYEDLGTITGDGGDNVSSSLVFRVERLQDDPSDTYDGANEFFFLLDLDFHFQIDSPGSRNETSK